MRSLILLAAPVLLAVSINAAEPFARTQLESLALRLQAGSAPPPPLPAAERALRPWSRAAQLAGLPPISGTDETVRFVVLGDIEPGRFWFARAFPPKRDAFERQMRELQREEPAFVLQLGDIVSRGTPQNFANLLDTLDRVAYRPFFPVVGNHDRPNTHGHSDKNLFTDIFGAGDFYFDLGGYRFVLLDNSNWELTPAQLAWLDAALATPLKTIVSMHIPPSFLRGRLVKPHRDPKEAPVAIKESVGWFAAGALEFGEIMTRRGVARVYLGHLHALAYADYGGVRYVLSGGGGSPLYRAPGIPGKKTPHYIVVEAGPAGITERIETLKGETLSFAKP